MHEVGVFPGEKFHSFFDGEVEENDASLAEPFPKCRRTLQSSNAVGFGLCEDGTPVVVFLELVPELGFESFLIGLGLVGRISQNGSAMISSSFEVENLGPLFFQLVQEESFSAAGEASESDELWARETEGVFQIIHEPFAP